MRAPLTVGMAALLLAGCGTSAGGMASPEPPSSVAPSPSISSADCARTRQTMHDFTTAFASFAQAMKSGDPASVLASADALSYSADQLLAALPEVSSSSSYFIDQNEQIARMAKSAIAANVDLKEVIGQISSILASSRYVAGSKDIAAAVDRACGPESPGPTGS